MPQPPLLMKLLKQQTLENYQGVSDFRWTKPRFRAIFKKNRRNLHRVKK
jgi:hypothetical protein